MLFNDIDSILLLIQWYCYFMKLLLFICCVLLHSDYSFIVLWLLCCPLMYSQLIWPWWLFYYSLFIMMTVMISFVFDVIHLTIHSMTWPGIRMYSFYNWYQYYCEVYWDDSRNILTIQWLTNEYCQLSLFWPLLFIEWLLKVQYYYYCIIKWR